MWLRDGLEALPFKPDKLGPLDSAFHILGSFVLIRALGWLAETAHKIQASVPLVARGGLPPIELLPRPVALPLYKCAPGMRLGLLLHGLQHLMAYLRVLLRWKMAHLLIRALAPRLDALLAGSHWYLIPSTLVVTAG
jgi:hypothetical protein